MEDSTALNIAVIPPLEIRKKAIELSQEVSSKFPSEFVLNEEDKIPHISIYQASFPLRNIGKIEDAVGQVSKRTKRISFNLNNFTVDYDTFLFWNSEKTNYLLKVQRDFIDAVNPFREGLIQPVLRTLANVPEEEREYIERYGYPTVGNRFRPHITITRARSKDGARQMVETLERSVYTFETDRMVLAYLGNNGAVREIISEFHLRD